MNDQNNYVVNPYPKIFRQIKLQKMCFEDNKQMIQLDKQNEMIIQNQDYKQNQEIQMDADKNANLQQSQLSQDRPSQQQQSDQQYNSAHDPKFENHSNNKGCNCKKSKCLKFYCQCYVTGNRCTSNCKCIDCQNTVNNAVNNRIDNDDELQAIRKSKIQNRGCNCRKSECLKKYCECFNAGIACNNLCKCEECKNTINGDTSEPIHNTIEHSQLLNNHKIKNKQFNEKLENLLINVPESQKQSMLQFLYYLLC